jgi:hypothetical protein
MLIALAILAAIIVALLGYASTRPDEFQVRRSLVVQAAADKVQAEVSDFHRWAAWSPWEKLDPAMQRTYGGSASGVGTHYAWEGKKVGSGRMEIMQEVPGAIIIKLDFLRPFEAHNTAEFNFVARGGGTEVSWTMRGSSPFMIKLMGIFMSMDKMVGKDFEAGLANLKTVVEQ